MEPQPLTRAAKRRPDMDVMMKFWWIKAVVTHRTFLATSNATTAVRVVLSHVKPLFTECIVAGDVVPANTTTPEPGQPKNWKKCGNGSFCFLKTRSRWKFACFHSNGVFEVNCFIIDMFIFLMFSWIKRNQCHCTLKTHNYSKMLCEIGIFSACFNHTSGNTSGNIWQNLNCEMV